MTMAKNRVPADDFCAGCGMCCDGTLHTRAKIQPHDDTTLMDAGGLQRFAEASGQEYFRQPCAYLRDNLCSIYETRFSICRTYRCALLQSFHDGQITVEIARAKIAIAKALRAKIIAASPKDSTYASRYRSRMKIEAALPKLKGQKRLGALEDLLRFVALDTYLDAWFRKKRDQDGPGEIAAPPD